jgi:hypothetical protein
MALGWRLSGNPLSERSSTDAIAGGIVVRFARGEPSGPGSGGVRPVKSL